MRAPHANGKLLAETARHLAVRMSFEDVIRVAEAKIAPERFRRIEGEINAKDQPYVITEFLKPGIEELCQVLPPRLARAIVGYAEKRGWLGTVYFGMELKTTTVWGYLRFWGLAKLKRFRPNSWRFHEEQIVIEAWLARVVAAAKLSGDLALEVAECARLIKGYGDTWKRGCVELRDDRGARHRAGARRPHPGARRHRCGRIGPHRRAARSGRRGSCQGTRGDRRAGGAAARGGVAEPSSCGARSNHPGALEACVSTEASGLRPSFETLLACEAPQDECDARYFLSATCFNCASPFSNSGPSIFSIGMNRQIALPMKFCVPIMVQITLVRPPLLGKHEIRMARAFERLRRNRCASRRARSACSP